MIGISIKLKVKGKDIELSIDEAKELLQQLKNLLEDEDYYVPFVTPYKDIDRKYTEITYDIAPVWNPETVCGSENSLPDVYVDSTISLILYGG